MRICDTIVCKDTSKEKGKPDGFPFFDSHEDLALRLSGLSIISFFTFRWCLLRSGLLRSGFFAAGFFAAGFFAAASSQLASSQQASSQQASSFQLFPLQVVLQKALPLLVLLSAAISSTS